MNNTDETQNAIAGARVALIMGSHSDWECMQHAASTLDELHIQYDAQIVSAHRTPEAMVAFAKSAEQLGFSVIIACAGGAAHLPGMVASLTLLPVIGVPAKSATLHGVDSLLSIVQMPAGVPVGTMAIGKAGAINAALFAARIVAPTNADVHNAIDAFMKTQTATVLRNTDPTASSPNSSSSDSSSSSSSAAK